MSLPALSVTAILLGLAAGLTLRHTQKPTLIASPTYQPTPTLATTSTQIINSFPEFTSTQAISPEAQKQADLYIFLHQANPQELTDHWLSLLADKNTTEESLADFADLWIQRDPANALHHLSQSKFQDLYWWTFARHDPQKALAQVDPKNTKLYAKILHAIGTTNPDLAITLLTGDLSTGNRIRALGGIIAGLFERSPREALDFAYQHRSRQDYHLSEHLNKWAAHSPHEAFAWALHHPEIQRHNLSAIGSILFEKDPAYLTTEIAKLPNGKVKAELLQAQAIHLAQTDSRSALDFAKSQTPFLQKNILKGIGPTIAEKSPDLSLDVLSQIFTQELNADAIESTASPIRAFQNGSPPVTRSQWTKDLIRQNPQAVMQLASEADAHLSPYHTTSRQVLSVWLDQNPTSAKQWLDEQPPGDLRDHLYSKALNELGFNDPTSLPTHLDLSQKIQDPELRQTSLNELFNSLAADHRDQLDTLLKGHQFTPEQQKAYEQRGFN